MLFMTSNLQETKVMTVWQ